MEKNGKEMKDIHKKALQLRGVYVKEFRRKRQKEERTLPNTLSHLQSPPLALLRRKKWKPGFLTQKHAWLKVPSIRSYPFTF